MLAAKPDIIETADWAFTYEVRGCPSSFDALYRGDKLGCHQRGIAAVIAQGDQSTDAGLQAAELAVYGFAEGYFGAAATLSHARAGAQALQAINGWMFGQGRSGSPLNASFGAILLTGQNLGFLTIGSWTIFLWRNAKLIALSEEASGTGLAQPALGTMRDVAIEYREIQALPGDLYLLGNGPVSFDVAQDVCQGRTAPPNAAILMIGLHRLPVTRLDDIGTGFQGLPLRAPPQEGETLDGFVIGRTVYRSRYTLLKRARDTVDGREVLMKFPLPAMLQDDVFRAGFVREAWVGRSTLSPWIADYISLSAERQSCLYIVIVFYHGETLEHRLSKPPPVGLGEGIGIALNLCAAVTDLDKMQIIHHDLKPDNILLTRGGGLRLLDLGLAYLPGIDDPEDDRLGGTALYMAPELFRKTPPDARSEVFAIGVTLHRMFSGGASPFGSPKAQPLVRKRPDLPAWLGHSIARAISGDAALRFANAAAFAQALEGGLMRAEEAVTAPSLWQRRLQNLRFWQAATLFSALGLLLTLLWILFH